jgi:acyl-coenzyme A thioesterase PaaI-like protein
MDLKRHLLKLANLYPPFLGAGIRVLRISEDHREIDVEMRLRVWNRNLVGTHYGGSLYSMADPFFMMMLMQILGPDYIVWDKAAAIRFRKPGRGTVRAAFRIPREESDAIIATLSHGSKCAPKFTVLITNEAGETVAEVEKILSVQRRAPATSR